MLKFFGKYTRNKSGANSIEYAIIASVIAVGIIASASMTGCQTNLKLWETSIKVAVAK